MGDPADAGDAGGCGDLSLATNPAPILWAGSCFLVRPAGRSYLEVKVLYGPGKGNR
jgi:hypothetical protein